MKLAQRILIAALFLFTALNSYSKNLQAVFSYSRFYSIKEGPFLETYLLVNGRSAHYLKNKEGIFQAAININIAFSNFNNEKVYSDNYNLLSPAINDTGKIDFNFIDQQRILLNNGLYKIDLTISDLNIKGKVFVITDTIKINFNDTGMFVSDLLTLDNYRKTETEDRFSKSGFTLVPFVDNFYPKEITSLKFYAEVYYASKIIGEHSPYLLTYYLEDADSKIVLDEFKTIKKQNAETVSVVLSEFNISQLPSGNYFLVLEIRDRNNQLIDFSQTYFQRSNNQAVSQGNDIANLKIENTFVASITNHDELVESIACLRPICNATESTWLNNQLKTADNKLMQQFLFDFWHRRNSMEPEKDWIEYKQQVNIAQKLYGNKFLKGYNSERGRVFLQYGFPNSVVKNDHEPDAYPYEIWQYYKIKNQTNRKFVFYNPEIVGEDYKLLHSDMPGEISNANWSMQLYKRNSQSDNMDIEKRHQFIGNQSQESFDNPK